MGTLYLVSTPIGNLEDVTLRALRILQHVSVIAAEDTRTTRKLLSHYDIHTPLRPLRDAAETLGAFESPHRLRATLGILCEELGDRRVAVCRELTKVHEEVFRGTLSEAREDFGGPRGG